MEKAVQIRQITFQAMKTKSIGGRTVELLLLGVLLCGVTGANAALETSLGGSETGATGTNPSPALSGAVRTVLPGAEEYQTPLTLDLTLDVAEVTPFALSSIDNSGSDKVRPDSPPTIPEPATTVAGGVALIAALSGGVRRRLARC
jgi:hypothetical protein